MESAQLSGLNLYSESKMENITGPILDIQYYHPVYIIYITLDNSWMLQLCLGGEGTSWLSAPLVLCPGLCTWQPLYCHAVPHGQSVPAPSFVGINPLKAPSSGSRTTLLCPKPL